MVVNYENIPSAISYIIVWIIIAVLFFIAGIMKLNEEQEEQKKKCDRCKYKYVCTGLCVNKDGRYNIK